MLRTFLSSKRGGTGARVALVAFAALAVTVAACRGGGSNPSNDDQKLPFIQPTTSANQCINDAQPEDAPQFAAIDVSRYIENISGLKYYDVAEGAGETPLLADAVRIEYTGWLDNGCMVDTSYVNEGPSTFPMITMIPGWREAFSTMKEGGIRVVEIPSDLGFGAVGSPPRIGGDATLVFYLEFIERLTLEEAQATVQADQATATAEAADAQATSTVEAAEAAASATAAAATSVALGTPLPTATPVSFGVTCRNDEQPGDAPQFADIDLSRLQTLQDGVRYYDIEVGDGPNPSATDRVDVSYTGWLLDGCLFDSSYARGTAPSTFSLNGVIDGWQIGITDMKVGGVRVLEIGPALGYGADGFPGAIPANATLVFYVRLIAISS
jgi:FKBP-type peptidyl-prolyl cis-trans isomerase